MLNVLIYIFSFLWLLTLNSSEKVLIITHAYNRPEFLDLQYRCFKKFLNDDYEFVVFNDAPKGLMHNKIVSVCKKLNIKCLPIPQKIHDHPQEEPFWQTHPGADGTRRHVDGIQYSLDKIGYDHDGIVAFFDSDLFLIKPFSISKIIENYDIVSIMKGPWDGGDDFFHLWPGLTFLAMDRLPNRKSLDFKCGRINGRLADTGGYTYYYLKNNNGIRLLQIGRYEMRDFFEFRNDPFNIRLKKYKDLGFGSNEIDMLQKYPDITVEFYYFNHFLHHGIGRFKDMKKTNAVLKYLKTILAQ